MVVEQHADSHAAVSRSLQCFEEQEAGEILLPDVVLRIDRTIRGIDQVRSSRECIEPVRQREHSGFRGPALQAWSNRASESRARHSTVLVS